MPNEKLVAAIMAAVGAHSMWKARLKAAIASGKVEPAVDIIAKDDQCAFGKWLYGKEIEAADRMSPYYKKVIALHAEFHRQAARVAGEVLAGNKDTAIAHMELGGDYGRASDLLTKTMLEWKNAP